MYIWRILLLLVLLSGPLFSTDSKEEEETKSENVSETSPPNPGNLATKWWIYFEASPEELNERRQLFIEQQKDLLSTLDEDEETRSSIERLLKEISTYLEALAALKVQKTEKPDVEWIPKRAYSLQEYLSLQDKVRKLDREIDGMDADLVRLTQFISELKQLANNNYAGYIDMQQASTKKFINGLEQVSEVVRILYLEEQSRLLKEKLAALNTERVRFREEAGLARSHINFEQEPQALRKELEEATLAYDSHHQSVLTGQQNSVSLYAPTSETQQSWRARNRELIRDLVKDVRLMARVQLVKAKQALQNIVQDPNTFQYDEEASPIIYFVTTARKQMHAWERTAAIDFEALGHKSSAFEEDGKTNPEFEQQLRIALQTMSFLDELSLELFHIQKVMGLVDQQVLATQSWWERMFIRLQYGVQQIQSFVGDWFYNTLFTVSGVPVTAMALLKALTLFILVLLVSKVARRSMTGILRKQGRLDESIIFTFDRVFNYTLLIIAVLLSLVYLGIDLGNVALVFGALGVGIGFGLQNVVSNFFSGLSILFGRNVRIGDYVELDSGHIGRITEVNVQTTSIRTFDGLDVMVPNANVVGSRLINWTKADPFVRFHIPFSVAYGTDEEFTQRAIIDAAYKVPITVGKLEGKAAPEIWLTKFGDNGLEYELIVWANVRGVAGRSSVRASYMAEVQRAIRENKLEVPYPQRDLHIKSWPSKDHAPEPETQS